MFLSPQCKKNFRKAGFDDQTSDSFDFTVKLRVKTISLFGKIVKCIIINDTSYVLIENLHRIFLRHINFKTFLRITRHLSNQFMCIPIARNQLLKWFGPITYRKMIRFDKAECLLVYVKAMWKKVEESAKDQTITNEKYPRIDTTNGIMDNDVSQLIPCEPRASKSPTSDVPKHPPSTDVTECNTSTILNTDPTLPGMGQIIIIQPIPTTVCDTGDSDGSQKTMGVNDQAGTVVNKVNVAEEAAILKETKKDVGGPSKMKVNSILPDKTPVCNEKKKRRLLETVTKLRKRQK